MRHNKLYPGNQHTPLIQKPAAQGIEKFAAKTLEMQQVHSPLAMHSKCTNYLLHICCHIYQQMIVTTKLLTTTL